MQNTQSEFHDTKNESKLAILSKLNEIDTVQNERIKLQKIDSNEKKINKNHFRAEHLQAEGFKVAAAPRNPVIFVGILD